jgi:hypothetical protein
VFDRGEWLHIAVVLGTFSPQQSHSCRGSDGRWLEERQLHLAQAGWVGNQLDSRDLARGGGEHEDHLRLPASGPH